MIDRPVCTPLITRDGVSIVTEIELPDRFENMAMQVVREDSIQTNEVAGGHTFGKAHGAGDPTLFGDVAEGPAIQDRGFGGLNRLVSGRGGHITNSGLEGAWKSTPTIWDNGYSDMLFGYEWKPTNSPAGAIQWREKDCRPAHMITAVHETIVKHAPFMTRADLPLRFDPIL